MNGNATEPAYNFALARLLREEGLTAEAEQRRRFGRRRGQADVLLDFDDYAVVIEAEFGNPAKEDANRRFPKQQPAIVNGLPVRLVVALAYPERLADLPESRAEENLAACDDLRVLYRYWGEEWSDETSGKVADLAETLRDYWVQTDDGTGIDRIVQRAADAINDASAVLSRNQQTNGAEQDEPATKALIWLNALLFQELLARHLDPARLDEPYRDNERIPRPEPDQGPTPLIEQWDEILNINWWPIFWIARETLAATPAPINSEAIAPLKAAAAEIAESGAVRRHDVAGRIFHRLLDSRKFLATNYTTIPASILLAGLAFDPRSQCWQDTEWTDPSKVAELRVVDPACGSGTLLMAAAQEVLKHARRSGLPTERKRELVRAVLEDAVYGFDVVPAAIHLAASTLCMAEASQVIKDMNLWRVQHEVVGTVPRLGSLDFLASSPSSGNAGRLDLFDDERFTRMTGQGEVAEAVAMPRNCDLIIANPPYTRAGGPGKEANTIWNPMFGSLLDATDAQTMQNALRTTLAETPASLYAGLGSAFVVLADENLEADGRMAFVLPATLLTGSRWSGIRNLLRNNYVIDWIIASHDKRHRSKRSGLPGRNWVSFSESTRIAEVLIVATKKPPRAGGNCLRFVNLLHNPDEPVQAMALTRKLLETGEEATPLESRSLDIGGKHWGNVIDVPQEELTDGAWSWGAFVQPDLVLRARNLRHGNYASDTTIPVTEIGALAELGPYHMQIKNPQQGLFTIVETDDPLRAGIPALWHHSSSRETRLQVTANARLERRSDREQAKQDAMLAKEGRLHLAGDLRMAPQRLAAVLTDRPMLGVRSWVTLALRENAPGMEEALCLWLNSTPGLLLRILHGNSPYLGRSGVPHELIRTLPALDVRQLTPDQLAAAVRVYEDLKNLTLQGFSQIQDDPVRKEINARLCEEVLGVNGAGVESLGDRIQEPGSESESLKELVDELTRKLALEPTLHARH